MSSIGLSIGLEALKKHLVWKIKIAVLVCMTILVILKFLMPFYIYLTKTKLKLSHILVKIIKKMLKGWCSVAGYSEE